MTPTHVKLMNITNQTGKKRQIIGVQGYQLLPGSRSITIPIEKLDPVTKGHVEAGNLLAVPVDKSTKKSTAQLPAPADQTGTEAKPTSETGDADQTGEVDQTGTEAKPTGETGDADQTGEVDQTGTEAKPNAPVETASKNDNAAGKKGKTSQNKKGTSGK